MKYFGDENIKLTNENENLRKEIAIRDGLLAQMASETGNEIKRLRKYITALENCDVRSKTVIKILRTQTGMED